MVGQSVEVGYMKAGFQITLASEQDAFFSMKYGSPKVYPRPGHSEVELEVDKTQSKFNRKQVLPKQSKKRCKNIAKQDHRICFMSPEKISTLLTQSQNSFHSGRSPSYLYSSPQFPQQQSLIHNDPFDNGNKLNDSLLSIYNQLHVEKDSEISSLKVQLAKLSQVIEQLEFKLKASNGREQEMEYLQQYLIKRQTDICQIHEKNAELKDKNNKLLKEKEIIYKEGEYLRKLYEKERIMHQNQINCLRNDVQMLKDREQKITEENQDLRDELRRIQSQGVQYFLRQHSLQDIEREDIDSSPDDSPESPTKTAVVLSTNPMKQNLATSLKLKDIKSSQQQRKSYNQLLSSRSSKLIPSHERDQDDDFSKRSKRSEKRCGCRAIIESLYQKIRYNEIQIDILKRVKAKGQTVKIQNQRLKKHNASLLNRIQYLIERGKKKQTARRKDSGQSLEFSLSPSHKNQRS